MLRKQKERLQRLLKLEMDGLELSVDEKGELLELEALEEKEYLERWEEWEPYSEWRG